MIRCTSRSSLHFEASSSPIHWSCSTAAGYREQCVPPLLWNSKADSKIDMAQHARQPQRLRLHVPRQRLLALHHRPNICRPREPKRYHRLPLANRHSQYLRSRLHACASSRRLSSKPAAHTMARSRRAQRRSLRRL